MNLATLVVAAMVATVFVLIVGAAIRARKKGKPASSCGGDCSRCSRCGH